MSLEGERHIVKARRGEKSSLLLAVSRTLDPSPPPVSGNKEKGSTSQFTVQGRLKEAERLNHSLDTKGKIVHYSSRKRAG